MTLGEISIINRMIRDCSGKKNLEHEIFVDNLHSPYAEFNESYILPAVQTQSIDFQAAKKYMDTIIKYIPEAIEGCSILPEARPKRESDKIFLVKKISSGSKIFLYILKLEPVYLGGANLEQIQEKATQEKTVSIKTNRIYFSIRIIPLEEIMENDQTICDFQAKNYAEGIYKIETTSSGVLSGKKTVSELFDEIDFGDLVQSLKDIFHITNESWKLGKVFEPVGVEYLTVSLKFLTLSQKEILEDFQSFQSILDILYDNGEPSVNSIENYVHWLNLFSMERLQSSSGNMRWKIFRKES